MSKPPSKPPGNHQPAPVKKASVAISQTTTIQQGPLPSPDILHHYNQVLPGSADRIISMAEHDFAHLHSIEKMRLSAIFLERRLGQVFAFVLTLAILGTIVWLAQGGHDKAVEVVGGGTIVSVVAVFILGRFFPAQQPSKLPAPPPEHKQ